MIKKRIGNRRREKDLTSFKYCNKICKVLYGVAFQTSSKTIDVVFDILKKLTTISTIRRTWYFIYCICIDIIGGFSMHFILGGACIWIEDDSCIWLWLLTALRVRAHMCAHLFRSLLIFALFPSIFGGSLQEARFWKGISTI